MKEERRVIKKAMFYEAKKIKKLKNMNEGLKLTEEEKVVIEKRINKELDLIKTFESALILYDYFKNRDDLILQEKEKNISDINKYKEKEFICG
jgi:hypothetical protein